MGTHRLVFIRTDGNQTIATGHLMRCLSIAQACIKCRMQVCFLVSDKESESLLKGFLSAAEMLQDSAPSSSDHSAKNDCSIVCIPGADYQHLEQELPFLFSVLTAVCDRTGHLLKDTVFLLDSYYVTKEYLQALQGKIKTAYLDDLQLFDYPVNLLINYDIIPDTAMGDYLAAYKNAGQRLLGGKFTPLRNQFQEQTPVIRDNVKNILITTGGSDPYHFCLNFLKALQDLSSENNFCCAVLSEKILIHIVIGKLSTDRAALYELTKALPFLRLHENVSDMAGLMAACDLAVSAAGTTLYELCALGIPAISYTMADNQIVAAQAFHTAFQKETAIPYAGDIRTRESQVLQTVFSFMTEMSESKLKRETASRRMRRLVDGNGALRIAEALTAL